MKTSSKRNIGFLLLISLWAILGAVASPLAQRIEGLLAGALSDFERGNASKGAVALLDAVLLVKPLEAWPQGFEKWLTTAKAEYGKADFSKGVDAVSRALALIGETPAAPSRQAMEPAPLALAFKAKITAAKACFAQGSGEEGAIAILHALQLLAPREH